MSAKRGMTNAERSRWVATAIKTGTPWKAGACSIMDVIVDTLDDETGLCDVETACCLLREIYNNFASIGEAT